MEFFKQFSEFLDERVKSPIYAFIVFSFVVINWQALFHLFFQDASAYVRLAYFDTETNYLSLIVYPIFAGILGAMASPWLAFAGAWWAMIPTKKRKLGQINLANELQEARATLEKIAVEKQITRAIQDLKISTIDDEQIQNQVRKEVSRIRNLAVHTTTTDPSMEKQTKKKQLSSYALNLLKAATSNENAELVFGLSSDGKETLIINGLDHLRKATGKTRVFTIKALKELIEIGFISQYGNANSRYRVTTTGFEYLDNNSTE